MSRKNKSVFLAGLKVVTTFVGIVEKYQNESKRYTLNELRKAKLAQEINISRVRQQVLLTNLQINVRRSTHKIEQDMRKVELQDYQIEMQKLKVMEMQKKLGITTDEFSADYDSEAGAPAELVRYAERTR